MMGKKLPVIMCSTLVLSLAVLLLLAVSAKAASPQILKIGYIGPLTGPGSWWGQSCLKLSEIATDEVNKKGLDVKGVPYKFELVVEDDAYMADKAVDRLRKLIDKDQVKIVLGSLGSASSLAEAPICAANKVLHLTDSFDPRIIAPTNDYSFMSSVLPKFSGPGQFDLIMRLVSGVKKICFVTVDDATGWAAFQLFETVAKNKGISCQNEAYQRGVIEFGPLSLKVVSTKPDLIFLCGTPPGDSNKIGKGIREAGYKGVMGHSSGWNFEEFHSMVGDAIGTIYANGGIGEKPYASQDYIGVYSEYLKRHGKKAWCELGLVFYTWVKVYAQAIEAAKSSDSTVIRNLLATPGKEWYHIMGGKGYMITDEIAKQMGLGSTRYFNAPWQCQTWDNKAKKIVNAGWTYPVGWPGGKLPD